jgi:enoyl-CoA hydratase/carnithine racemase
VSDATLVRVEEKGSGLRVLTMDRPPVNALGRDLVRELGEAVGRLHDDAEARCLLLRSAGKHFCAGADLKERAEMAMDEVRAFVPRLAALCTGLAELPFPTVAAVRGAAAGGGCELAIACDLRVLADDARIGLRETALGIIPGAGGTQRLARIAGSARAKRWIFTARMHEAAEALADGVADRVVPAHRLDEEAEDFAASIASNAPLALRLAKRAIDGGLDGTLGRGLELEWECYLPTLDTEDRVEALRAFAEKRPPRFRGR